MSPFEKLAYEAGSDLAYSFVKESVLKKILLPQNLGLAGLGMGGAYGLMGDPGDPYAEYNRPGFTRGAALWGSRGLGAGLGHAFAKGIGVNPVVGLAGGLLLGNVFGRGIVGPERQRVTGPVGAMRA